MDSLHATCSPPTCETSPVNPLTSLDAAQTLLFDVDAVAQAEGPAADLELTVVMPCLNEERTLQIGRAHV